MKRFSSIIILFVLSGSILFLGQCSTAQRSTASEQEIPSNADPALVRKSRELVRQGNLQVVRKNYGEALRLANESIRTLPLF
ncbi:MAG: hypothetical protein KDK33_20625, partial [Leptospiraceae bacterium]|nr:hypothetical protein [Leptospiraceae bacterium]